MNGKELLRVISSAHLLMARACSCTTSTVHDSPLGLQQQLLLRST